MTKTNDDRKLMEKVLYHDKVRCTRDHLRVILLGMQRDMDKVAEVLGSNNLTGLRDTSIEEYAATFAPSFDTLMKVQLLKQSLTTYREVKWSFGKADEELPELCQDCGYTIEDNDHSNCKP